MKVDMCRHLIPLYDVDNGECFIAFNGVQSNLYIKTSERRDDDYNIVAIEVTSGDLEVFRNDKEVEFKDMILCEVEEGTFDEDAG